MKTIRQARNVLSPEKKSNNSTLLGHTPRTSIFGWARVKINFVDVNVGSP